MATLKNVQMGWKGLQDVINRIIDTVNSQTPVEGSGVRIVDTSNGKLISVAAETSSQDGSGGGAQQSSGGGNLVAVTIQAFDINNNPVSLMVMVPASSSDFGPSTLQWQPITVVDPGTCAAGTMPLLGQAPQ